MERLTFEGNFCDIAQCSELPCKHGGDCSQKQVWERLKDYEDAGLSPQACAEVREIEETLSGCDYSISRMAELMKADKDGRVVVLPCKVGDKLYRVFAGEIFEIRVGSMKYFAIQGRWGIETFPFCPCVESSIGNTVFLTREEAEKALQKMQGKEKADGTDNKPE